MEPVELVGLLAEPERLKVAAALALGARTPSEIVTASGLSAKDVVAALRRLRAGGLVEDAPGGYALRDGLFKQVVREAAPPRPIDKPHGYADPSVERLVRAFVRDGRLVGLPAQRARRRAVLEHVVDSFEPGVHYAEREVDAVLRALCAGAAVDHVTLRRHLVDESLLDRDGGQYWRSGGWFDVTP